MDELPGIVRFTFHAGMVEEFKRLSAECIEIVRSKDVGTLQYNAYFNDDESQAIVLERVPRLRPRSSCTARTWPP